MRIRDFFFRNLLAKIFSLFFAVLLWGVVIGEKHAQVQLTVPLDLVNIPDKAVVISDVPPNVAVQVQGPRTLLRTIQGRDIRRNVDLKGIGVGWTTIRILPDSIPVPRGIEVLRVTPATLDLKLEPVREVRIPVAPQVTGEPAKGYRVEGVSVEPLKVLLKGGDSELSGLAGVRTRPVSVAQASTDVEERVGFEMEGLHLLEVTPAKAWVRVKILPIIMERSLENVSVRIIPPEAKVSVEPAKIRVFLKGPMELLEGVKEMDLQATVDVQGFEPGKRSVTVGITAPQGIQVVGTDPPRVDVTVQIN